MRLILTQPCSDETISSILDRACSVHRLPRAILLRELCPGISDWPADIDLDVSPPPALVSNLAKALGLDPACIDALRLGDFAWRLIPKARIACCPECLNEDVRSGRDPYFRADWSWCFMTHCVVHQCPLEVWSPINLITGQRYWYRLHLAHGADFVPVPEGYDMTRPFSSVSRVDWDDPITRRVWRAIMAHERDLLALMQASGSAHRVSRARIRKLYVLAAGKWSGVFKWSLMNQLIPIGSAQRLFTKQPCGLLSGVGVADSWKRFRCIRVPAYRRSAVWMVSQLRNPGPAAALQWFPNAGKSKRRHWLKPLVWECLSESGRVLFLEVLLEDKKYQGPDKNMSHAHAQKSNSVDKLQAT
ncbi:MAG TPA: TniQ family protein [Gammaproteobacteria bacterium]|nr:TniQ family protein [Gammaproteobacteria bacterium]